MNTPFLLGFGVLYAVLAGLAELDASGRLRVRRSWPRWSWRLSSSWGCSTGRDPRRRCGGSASADPAVAPCLSPSRWRVAVAVLVTP